MYIGSGTDGLAPWLPGHWAALALALVLVRMAISRFSQSGVARGLKRRVAIIGATDLGRSHIERLAGLGAEYELAGVFDDRVKAARRVFVRQLSGTVSDLVEITREERVDHVVIALPSAADARVAEIASRFQAFPVDVSIGFDQPPLQVPVKDVERIDDLIVLTVYKTPLNPAESIVKRIEDMLIAGTGLLLLAPLLLFTALAIKLDSRGPVLFKQQRHGFRNRPFLVYKFRTMHAATTDHAGNRLTEADDPRITRVGRFLRRFSLDEAPQLLNVLKGDMSVVGPRPHALAASAEGIPYAETADNYALRQRIKPGLTGWAQVNGWRGPTDTLEQIRARLAHDIYYTENWSVQFDLLIILRTLPAVFLPPPTAF